VKTGRAALGEVGTFFFAGDDDHAGLQHDADAVGVDAGHVEHDLDVLLGLEHIHDRHALAGHHVTAIGTPFRQIVEQPPDIVGQISRIEIHRARRIRAHGFNCKGLRS
jgi:hypothetical protein